jgi:cytochrome c-type biogenesis protein CcmH/NrfG
MGGTEMISTRRRIEFAYGYLALGMLVEASDELEAIEGEDRLSPEVMRIRSDLYTMAKQWDLLLAVSRELARQCPDDEEGWIGWAYALRELNRVPEALAVAREAEPLHGKKCAVLSIGEIIRAALEQLPEKPARSAATRRKK